MFKVSLLIRQIKYREKDNRPTMYLLSHYYLVSELKGDCAELIRSKKTKKGVEKGFGRDAEIARIESSFARFLRANYGVGEYSVLRVVGGKRGFKLFWRGVVEKDRFIRHGGSIAPHLLTVSPIRAWHDLKNERR